MSPSIQPRPPSRRPPLGDGSNRANSFANVSRHIDKRQARYLHHDTSHFKDDVSLSPPIQNHQPASYDHGSPSPLESPGPNVPNPHLSALSKGDQPNSNRNSQISTTSTNASDSRRRKTHIGPWHLGKTLGKGATARVRMARHATTGQLAAIKIVQKKNAQLSQAGSLASLDRKDLESREDCENTIRRMPYGIEREVAIMKLIDHPHIMKLYDIWENRTEIYLVLEFVDNGELFEHISRSGRLPEEEAIKYFRQLLSAVGYCHQFNICHRDLKPENILLTKDYDIKIADFGMAALQQSPDHRLQTSCGSPHYAAPEVIKGVAYKGDKIDTWSMGVILYASLSGHLPFDNADLAKLLATIQKGYYRMDSAFGPEATDLIRRILQVDPRDRLNINQIWRHPLIRKYDHLDNFAGGIILKSPTVKDCGRPVIRKTDIDMELLRHMRSLWHHFEEKDIIKLLLNDKPNDQKLFYSLLLKHQEQQLENYTPDVAYSSSDYHHVRPLKHVKKLSTRQFSQPNANGVGRKISRFTIVSHASKTSHRRNNSGYAETDAGETVKSYDPFKASRPQHLAPNTAASHANIIVHRSHASEQRDVGGRHDKLLSRVKMNSTTPVGANGGSLAPPPRAFQSRSSLASSTRSRDSNGKVKPANHKRGVSFSHGRRSNNRLSTDERVPESNLRYSITAEGDPGMACSSPQLHSTGRYIRSRKAVGVTSQPLLNGKSLRKANRASYLFQEDVRQLSNSLAKDCDEAFNRTSGLSTIESENSIGLESPGTGYSGLGSSSAYARTNLSLAAPPKVPMVIGGKPWDNRPLPPPPDRTDSIQLELAEAQRQAHLRRLSGDPFDSPRYLDKMVDHIDRLVFPSPSTEHYGGKKRAVSEPLDMMSRDFGHALPAIIESSAGDEIDSDGYSAFIRMENLKNAANHTRSAQQAHTRRDYANEWETFTARGVPTSPARAPAPLNIRKNSQGRESGGPPMTSRPLRISQASRNSSGAPSFDFSEQTSNTSKTSYRQATTSGDDSFVSDEANGLSRKKIWFRRSEKSAEEKGIPTEIFDTAPAPYSNGNGAPTNKKKGFGLGNIFKRRSTKQADMSVGDDFEVYDDEIASLSEQKNRQITSIENPRTRLIEPQQNWLAKLFRVKPATKFMCFSLSKRRARQEVVHLLKDWRQYGMREIAVDKERNIVFGKVGAKNYLKLKEVSFACEIMTVIEHGKRGHLSIARFIQETGAASSFYKVAETLQTVLKSRGMLVADERKRRMMIKTLNSV